MSLECTKTWTGGTSSSPEFIAKEPDGKMTTADAGGGASSAIGGNKGSKDDATIDIDLQ